MENANPADPDFGICYCVRDSVMKRTPDGTVYCMSPSALAAQESGVDGGESKNCRDSGGNAVAGPKPQELPEGADTTSKWLTRKEVGFGHSEPRVS